MKSRALIPTLCCICSAPLYFFPGLTAETEPQGFPHIRHSEACKRCLDCAGKTCPSITEALAEFKPKRFATLLRLSIAAG